MTEIEKVSISGIGFLLESDAYRALAAYLDRLKAAYAANPDGGEIIADIEARVAELILQRQEAGSVVTQAVIADVVARLGMPEEGEAPQPTPERTFPRRLYRNRDGAKVGGVCSGLGAFFDIDPVWIRLGAFVPLIMLILTSLFGFYSFYALLGVTIGVIPLLYLLLWFAVPAARSPRQKMELRGEKITASSIESNFRQSAPRDAHSQRTASVWAELVYVLGRIVLFSVKAVAALVAFGFVVAGLGLLAALGTAIFAANKLVINNVPMADYLPSLSGITPEWYLVVTLAVALIPVVMVAVVLLRLIFERRTSGRTLSILGSTWLIITIFWGIVTIRNGQELYERLRTTHHLRITTRPLPTMDEEAPVPLPALLPADSVTTILTNPDTCCNN